MNNNHQSKLKGRQAFFTVPAKSVRTRALFWTFLHWVLRRRVPSVDREIGLKYVSKAIKFYSFADKITSYRDLLTSMLVNK
ncbi:hypothetical protein OUZ56_023820 [Daphnia magna]|uniref:Uncharacterized protein n=1 Tax=Daphnia magna TaxID=35525 RepID=A0ABR0AZL8_9CRUS|nr:hypothetical protein OUZ56_023820 [Daphnia magna]